VLQVTRLRRETAQKLSELERKRLLAEQQRVASAPVSDGESAQEAGAALASCACCLQSVESAVRARHHVSPDLVLKSQQYLAALRFISDAEADKFL